MICSWAIFEEGYCSVNGGGAQQRETAGSARLPTLPSLATLGACSYRLATNNQDATPAGA